LDLGEWLVGSPEEHSGRDGHRSHRSGRQPALRTHSLQRKIDYKSLFATITNSVLDFRMAGTARHKYTYEYIYSLFHQKYLNLYIFLIFLIYFSVDYLRSFY
jgi:hypothetical protein